MIIIAEKINGSIPSMGKAIAAKDEAHIKEMAVKQSAACPTGGRMFIDVCASVAPEAEYETLKWMLNLVQDATDLPISIDSPNAEILAVMLKEGVVKKPGLVNSVSMEGNKVDTIFPLIAKTDWEVVALLCDDTGIPKTAQKRKEVFDALMVKAEQYGIAPSRLHIDPLVEMLATSYDTDDEDANGIKVVVDVMQYIRSKYPEIHITGAISNISFNLPARKLVNVAFAIQSIRAGLDSAVFDPLDKALMGAIGAAEHILHGAPADELAESYLSIVKDALAVDSDDDFDEDNYDKIQLGILYATRACVGFDDFCMEYIGAARSGTIAPKL
ncbi:MAG: dihydropteroate synthase [Oscillospiraceae bacterium]|jgi:5-methyltetrahydrofolate--homocysteine methyltransferase|nr:dihydropteroate synthase [Oscillospiraceae bacterium]